MATRKSCTQCGACLNACPAFLLAKSEEYSPKAKHILLDKGRSDDGELDWRKTVDLAGRCACCERCLAVCPRHLSVPEDLAEARARHPRWQQHFWKEWIRRGDWLWKPAARLAPLVPNSMLPQGLGILHASALAMQEPEKTAPWLRLAASTEKPAAGAAFAVFGGCTANRLRPGWLRAAERAIVKLGGSASAEPGFVCCGGTYEHAGMMEQAAASARCNVSRWRALGKPRLLLFCASCLHSLRRYPAMEGVLDDGEAEAWLAALTPLSRMLARAGLETTPEAPAAVGYHSPCHWGAKDEDLALLSSALPGLIRGAFPCCGFGGVLKVLNPTLSKDMASACWAGLPRAADGAHLPVLTGCSGCALQLSAHAPGGARILHWLDVFGAD